MSLADYFENARGIGVLATADAQGNVDVALYARPHVISDEEITFIMGDRLSHDSVAGNPHAAYLFLEQSAPGHEQGQTAYNGLRLYLTRTKEETDPVKIAAIRRENRKGHETPDQQRFLVHFKVDRVRRLVGD
ncbi:MAG: pyridoxamine 5'-phosphate oxidase family protein [Phycisphaerales bacterium]